MGTLSVEELKKQSRSLRGKILEDLEKTTPFAESEYQLLKFHGTYQQFDRDTATKRKQQGLEKEYSLMIRVRMPGGRVTPQQYLALDDFSDRYANGTIRATTRQTVQYHTILKGNLKAIIANVNHIFLTTFATCGDVVRNVMTVPDPIVNPIYQRLRDDATVLSQHTLPKTKGYHEIWMDGKPLSLENEHEPLYGETYLPRKFKIGLTIPEDNSIDVLTNDLGILAFFNAENQLEGYNFYLGGGFGTTHNNPKTYPRIATPIAFIGPNDLISATDAVIKLQRDNGDRTDRKHARLKYLVEERGKDWIKTKLEEYFGRQLPDARPTPTLKIRDYLGWHEQGDGHLYFGIPIISGRIKDTDQCKLRTAIREVVSTFNTDVIFTPAQDIIFGNVSKNDQSKIEQILKNYGVILGSDLSPVRRWSLACPSLPTCGLGLAEAERIHIELIQEFEAALNRHNLGKECLSVRITGCPNGCARPYAGDIGIVGRMPEHYAIFVGGDFEGTRLNFKLLDKVHRKNIVPTLEPLFALFAQQRIANEGFGDFCHRFKQENLLAALS